MPALIAWRSLASLESVVGTSLIGILPTGRWLIAAAIVVTAAQMVLIAALLTQRRQRRLAEKALLSREAGLRISYRRTRQLARSLIHAQETARIALARDLHDDIGQDIIGVALAIDGFTHATGRVEDAKNQYALAKL